jgi:hypothetical protein
MPPGYLSGQNEIPGLNVRRSTINMLNLDPCLAESAIGQPIPRNRAPTDNAQFTCVRWLLATKDTIPAELRRGDGLRAATRTQPPKPCPGSNDVDLHGLGDNRR